MGGTIQLIEIRSRASLHAFGVLPSYMSHSVGSQSEGLARRYRGQERLGVTWDSVPTAMVVVTQEVQHSRTFCSLWERPRTKRDKKTLDSQLGRQE